MSLRNLTLFFFLLVFMTACGTTSDTGENEGHAGGQSAPIESARESEVVPAADAAGHPATTPFHGRPHAIPGRIEAEHYDEGPAGVAYHDVDAENQGADYRVATEVDIEKRDDASNGHGIGWTRPGEWVTYTVEIREAGEYEIHFPVASNKQGGVFHLEIHGKNVTGPIEIPDTGGWGKLEMIRAKTSPLEKGRFVMTMKMDSQGESGSIGDIDYLEFTRVP